MSSHIDKLKKIREQEGKKPKFLSKDGSGFSEATINPEYDIQLPDKLSEIETQIETLSSIETKANWHIGYRLLYIKEKKLFIDKYSAFEDYITERFNFSRKTLDRYLFIAENFDEKTALSFGSKLYLLRGLDKDNIKKYLDWMNEESPTFREIEKRKSTENSKPKIGRPKTEINMRGATITVNLKELNRKTIKKEKVGEFKEKLKNLILEYSE